MADADGEPRSACIVEPRSVPTPDPAGTGRHGLACGSCRHSREQAAHAPLAPNDTPIRTRREGLESQGCEELLRRPGRVNTQSQTQSLFALLIAPEGETDCRVGRVGRKPGIPPIDGQAGVEGCAKRSEQALHPPS